MRTHVHAPSEGGEAGRSKVRIWLDLQVSRLTSKAASGIRLCLCVFRASLTVMDVKNAVQYAVRATQRIKNKRGNRLGIGCDLRNSLVTFEVQSPRFRPKVQSIIGQTEEDFQLTFHPLVPGTFPIKARQPRCRDVVAAVA